MSEAKKPDKDRMERFAELIADDLSPQQAAERMGFSPIYGNALMQRLRKLVGWQAQ